jgi:hypothetical protein
MFSWFAIAIAVNTVMLIYFKLINGIKAFGLLPQAIYRPV